MIGNNDLSSILAFLVLAFPWKRTERYPMDDEALIAIQNAGYSLESIPEAHILVPLRRIESTQDGGTDEDITKTIHPDNIDLAIRAAKLFNLEVTGIDIITPDITIPWYRNGAIINEVNYSPQYGGGDISKSTIAGFLADFMQERGRIPITVILGGSEAMEFALNLLHHFRTLLVQESQPCLFCVKRINNIYRLSTLATVSTNSDTGTNPNG